MSELRLTIRGGFVFTIGDELEEGPEEVLFLYCEYIDERMGVVDEMGTAGKIWSCLTCCGSRGANVVEGDLSLSAVCRV